MKMKYIYKILRYAVEQIRKNNKKDLFLLIFSIIPKIGIAFGTIIIPQKIVYFLLEEQYRAAFESAFLLCCMILGERMYSNYADANKKRMEVELQVQMNSEISRAVMEADYEQVERKSYLEKVDFARRCVERKSILVVFQDMVGIVSGVLSLLGVLYIISEINAGLIAVIIASVIISAAGEVFRLHYVYERDKNSNEIERNLYYARNDLSSNKYAKDIRIWNLYNFISNKVQMYAESLCELWSQTSIKTVKAVGWTYLAVGLQYVVIYSFLAYMAYKGTISLDAFILYSSSGIAMGESLREILNSLIGMSGEYRYISSVQEITEQRVHNTDVSLPEEVIFQSSIEFQNVWFRYQESGEYILKNFQLVLEKGKKYSVVGKNGAGKTTFVKLLLGLYKPEKGRILIDGQRIEALDTEAYRKLFSCTFQDYSIYGFSIRENIAFGAGETGKIENVTARAGIKDKIFSLPKGIETNLNKRINEDATEFSGGQEQQLAIARALYKSAPIFILDEPTAALSPSSEIRLYQQFYNVLRDKTVIFISHRMASCVLSDEIILLNNGIVEEKGTHDALMKKRGLYYEMFSAQADPYQTGTQFMEETT